jgi:hypothetical protein
MFLVGYAGYTPHPIVTADMASRDSIVCVCVCVCDVALRGKCFQDLQSIPLEFVGQQCRLLSPLEVGVSPCFGYADRQAICSLVGKTTR